MAGHKPVWEASTPQSPPWGTQPAYTARDHDSNEDSEMSQQSRSSFAYTWIVLLAVLIFLSVKPLSLQAGAAQRQEFDFCAWGKAAAQGDGDSLADGRILAAGVPASENHFRYKLLSYIPHIADGVSARDRFNTTLMLVNAGEEDRVRVDFVSADGTPMKVGLMGSKRLGSSFEIALQPGESVTLRTNGWGPLKSGYIRIAAQPSVGITAVLTRSLAMNPKQNLVLSEVGLQAALPLSDFSIAVDSIGSKDTGLALVNPTGSEAQVTLRLYDQDVVPLAEAELTLFSVKQMSRFVWELFEAAQPGIASRAQEMRGTLTVQSDKPLVAVSLRQRDDPLLNFPFEVPTLATLSVAAGRFDQVHDDPLPGLSKSYLPYVSSGRVQNLDLATTLVLTNTGLATVAQIEFFDSQGNPLEVQLGDRGRNSVFEIVAAAGQSLFEPIVSPKKYLTGYARVTAAKAVSAGAILAGSNRASGIRHFEMGIPPTETFRQFSLALDSTGPLDTGLVLVHPSLDTGAPAAQATVQLYDSEYNLLASRRLTLQPGEHRLRMIFEFFAEHCPQIASHAQEMRGVLTVESDLPLTAIVLRGNLYRSQFFHDLIPVMTSYPVVARQPRVSFRIRGDQPAKETELVKRRNWGQSPKSPS